MLHFGQRRISASGACRIRVAPSHATTADVALADDEGESEKMM
jgi:hypothetical protein